MYKIPLVKPYLGKNAFKYVNECVETEWVSSQGRFVSEFEEKFAAYIGTRYAVAVSNGTSALHLGLIAGGVGKGDEVIVPDLTFCATINAVIYTGATPVIVDVGEDWNIDPEEIDRHVSPKTKAIIPVHLYGKAVDEIGDKVIWWAVEDCAEALGASSDGCMVGSMGDVGCFSFYGNKIITCGEGGMITTNSKEVNDLLRLYRDHGMSKTDRYKYEVVGYNYRMTNLQAALGLSQLEEIGFLLEKRNQIRDWYGKYLPVRKEGVNWLTTVLIPNRDEAIERLAHKGINSRPMFHPLSEMEIYKPYAKHAGPVASRISKQGISLPTYISMTKQDVEKVCEVLLAS